ncbi:hypothetical protein LTT66_32070 [Nocardia gipuzkoensis]|uniref:hypothetical protein n=1 Tax=Nocardia gipuzkoensis TaxID=2749991 RepID=UPI001E4C719F|nr:hypothetical protein [Nocardia gipuzkoensis]UGT67779.1 hypothetical protein LTT66_32070 [Nocardia gipuzkoensis]
MDRAQVLTALNEMVDDDGSRVIANDSCLGRPTTTWQHTIDDLQRRFLPPDRQHGPTPTADARQTHEQVLADSPFRHVNRQVYEFLRPWTIEQAIGCLYSTSLPLRRLLGGQRTAFEDAVTNTLLAIDATGHFAEPVVLEVLTDTKN